MSQTPSNTPPADDLAVGEIPLARMGPGGDLRAALLDLKAPWTRRGVARWLDLVDPSGRWPVAVLGALGDRSPPQLAGALVAVWAPAPLARFDALFELPANAPVRALERPQGGTWHFISVTTHASARGADLGRRLVKEALAWVARTSGCDEARTLSPVVGLVDLARRVAPGAPFAEAAMRALRSAARVDGAPALPILRLHLGAGAWLDRVLMDSRRDDVESGAVTLRFAYETDEAQRAARRDRYQRWCAERARAIASDPEAEASGDVWLVPDRGDEDLIGPAEAAHGPVATGSGG